jgi:hypothetical protein
LDSISPLKATNISIPLTANPTVPPAHVPVDSVIISRTENARRKNIEDLLLGKGPASNIRAFFEGKRSAHFSRSFGREFPQGGWKIEFKGFNTQGPNAVHLDNSHYQGIIINSDTPENRPFGRWKRLKEGWVGESTLVSEDPQSAIARSMLSTYLGDDGKMEMVLTEMKRGGGGILYHLDSEEYLKNPGITPPVKAHFDFPRGEINPSPPFPYHTSIPDKGQPLSARQFFRDWIADFEPRWAMPSLHTLQPGWEVKLNVPLSASDVMVVLGRGEQAGTKKTGEDPFDKECRMEWERVQGGWRHIKEGKLIPEGFINLQESSLETVLRDDGTVALTLKEKYETADGCVFELDGKDYIDNPRKPPAVLSTRPFGAKRAGEGNGMSPVAEGESNEDDREDVLKGDDWLIIGGIKIEVNKAEKTP